MLWCDLSLIKEIEKMVKDGYTIYSNPSNTFTHFGFSIINDSTLVNNTIKPEELDYKDTTVKIPLFDKYYFTSAIYEEEKSNPLDDFFGSIANCNISSVNLD